MLNRKVIVQWLAKTRKQDVGRCREGWDFEIGQYAEVKAKMKQERRLE